MPMGEISIIEPGLQLLVVDAGRDTHAQEIGFCASGALDQLSFELVNWLCDNALDLPALEGMGEFTLSVNTETVVAVGGPSVSVWQNDKPVALWQSLFLQAGDTLRIKPARLGTKTYVGVGGIIDLPVVQGSKSIVTREGVGGRNNDGASLKKGEVLRTDLHEHRPQRTLKEHEKPDYALDKPLDVVVGYQHAQFDNWQQQLFFASEYEVTNDISRMGYRLKGQSIAYPETDLYSEGINCGAIQFPGDGQPIVMLADRQTLGGYPKIGCVADYDLYRLAQAVPGDKITFQSISSDNARAKWLLRHRLEERIFESEETENGANI